MTLRSRLRDNSVRMSSASPAAMAPSAACGLSNGRTAIQRRPWGGWLCGRRDHQIPPESRSTTSTAAARASAARGRGEGRLRARSCRGRRARS